jgi:cytochrome oxidase Cu insertion factor (SCO1/SenC/PrrC family)
MSEIRKGKGRVQLLLVAAVFIGPLAVAAWLYFAGQEMTPESRTNSGALLEPIVNLGELVPESPLLASSDGRWVLLYANEGACDEACEFSLYTLRQSRLMLGREMDRLLRVFLHGDTAPDTVLLAEEHAGLITLQDSDLKDLLDNKKPANLETGGYYLVDPLGNLVLYFHPDIDPSAMVEDIKHLLELSRIG